MKSYHRQTVTETHCVQTGHTVVW